MSTPELYSAGHIFYDMQIEFIYYLGTVGCGGIDRKFKARSFGLRTK